jgi:alkanesulfonate monooxygenase SsuD/methylene tetrahydromethanopterin reductase-like flavin-dependent oxidoreductase (luciferase family)
MTRACKIGVQLPEVEWEVSWPELISMARTAEAVGFDSLWIGDHLLYQMRDGSHRGPWEVWTSLAALATVTDRIELGPLVASTSFHAPAMLAKQAATVDAISGGRLTLGLGAGWNAREYHAFGFPYDHRVSRFEEAFHIIRNLLDGDVVDRQGLYYANDRCLLAPAPIRPGKPPLMIGSVSPRMLDITLPYVDSWNVWFSLFGNTPDGFAATKATVDAACIAHGRDPSTIGATAAVFIQLPTGDGRAMGDDGNAPCAPISGSPLEIAASLAEFAAAGASHLQLVVDPITGASIESLAEVLNHFDQCCAS